MRALRHGVAPGHVAAAAAAAWVILLVVAVPVLAWAGSTPGNPLSGTRSVYLAAHVATLTGNRPTWATPADVGWPSVAVTLAAATCAWTFVTACLLRLGAGRPPGWAWLATACVPLLVFGVTRLAGGNMHDAASAFVGSGWLAEPAAGDSPRFWLMLMPLAGVGWVGPVLAARLLCGARLDPQVRLTLAAAAVALLAAMPVAWVASRLELAADAWAGFTDARTGLAAWQAWAVVPFTLAGVSGIAGGVRLTAVLLAVAGVVRLVTGRAADASHGVGLFAVAAGVGLFVVTFVVLTWALPTRPPADVALMAAGAVGNTATLPATAAGADAFVLAAAAVTSRVLSLGVAWWAVTRPGVTTAAA